MSVLFLALTFAVGVYNIAVAQFPCEITLNSTRNGIRLTATYNLCDYSLNENSQLSYYMAFDKGPNGNWESYDHAENFTFYFNVAANVMSSPPGSCDDYTDGMHPGYCKEIRSEGLSNATCYDNDLVPIKNSVAAYQYISYPGEETLCFRLHDGISSPIWTFLDESNPALGVQLTYINGDWCDPFGKNREFIIKFKCSNNQQITSDHIQTVHAPIGNGCSYILEIETFTGCPTQCPIDNDQLCSGHGVCDYDWKRGEPKCFCYCGYTGTDCKDHNPDTEECSNTNNTSSGVHHGAYDGCKFSLTDTRGITAEYDLEYFHLNYDVFTIVDANNPAFTYMFDICGGINAQLWVKNTTIPNECKHYTSEPYKDYAPCIKNYSNDDGRYTCVQYEDTTGEIPSAIQIDYAYNNVQGDVKCFWLGMEVASSDNLPAYSVELLDPDDAGKGVVFTILNGQWCTMNGQGIRNRELRVKLECPDDARIEFEPESHVKQFQNSVVEEIDTCVYEIQIASPNACPVQLF